jgi:mono/diheme cytochrome c family protein
MLAGLALFAAGVAHLTALTPASLPRADRAQASTLEGVYTRDQAKRGAAEYSKACASCHLEDLSGQHTSPALAGDTFTLRFEGQSLADLFERVKTTMPQGAAGSLSDQVYADVIAYILQANRYRPGAQELASDVERLRTIILKRPLER